MTFIDNEFAVSDRSYRISFRDGETFLLRDIYALDPSVSGQYGRYSGTIVSIERIDERRRRLFSDGSGIDFGLDEVLEIQDAKSRSVLFSREEK